MRAVGDSIWASCGLGVVVAIGSGLSRRLCVLRCALALLVVIVLVSDWLLGGETTVRIDAVMGAMIRAAVELLSLLENLLRVR